MAYLTLFDLKAFSPCGKPYIVCEMMYRFAWKLRIVDTSVHISPVPPLLGVSMVPHDSHCVLASQTNITRIKDPTPSRALG